MAQVNLGLLESQQSSGWLPSSHFQLDVTASKNAYYCSIFFPCLLFSLLKISLVNVHSCHTNTSHPCSLGRLG